MRACPMMTGDAPRSLGSVSLAIAVHQGVEHGRAMTNRRSKRPPGAAAVHRRARSSTVRAMDTDVIVEDFVPYRRSVLWQIHDLYYARRGITAFTDGDIPWRTTNNAGLARQYAELMIELWRARGDARADDEFTVVEIKAPAAACSRRTCWRRSSTIAATRGAACTRACSTCCRISRPARSARRSPRPPALRVQVERGRIVPATFDGRIARATSDGSPARPSCRAPALVIANYIACHISDDVPAQHRRRPCRAPRPIARAGGQRARRRRGPDGSGAARRGLSAPIRRSQR